MERWHIIACVLLHWRKHQTFNRSRKCRKCGLYLRDGAATPSYRRRST